MKIFNIFAIKGDGDSNTTFDLIGNSRTIEGAQKVIVECISNQTYVYQRVIEKIKLQNDKRGTVSIEMTNEEKNSWGKDYFQYNILPDMNSQNNFSVVDSRENIRALLEVDYHHFFNGFLIEEAELLD